MVEQDQKYIFKTKTILNRSGQAAVEYILLLVIIVSLVLAMKKGFGKMNDFMNRYIGDYIVCLMEYGELPGLGISDAQMKKHLSTGDGGGRKCDQEFAGFTFEDGRPPVSGSGGGSGSGSTGGRSNGSNSRGNNSGNANKDGSGSKGANASGANAGDIAGGGGSSGSRGKNSGKKASPYSKGQIVRSNAYGSADSGNDYGDDKVTVIDDPSAKKKRDSDRGLSRTSRLNYGSERYRAITGTMAAEIEKRAPKKPPEIKVSTRALAGETGTRFGPYKKTFTPPKVKEAQEMRDDNSGFSFGHIIRWLIIGGMILALIVFFGGQVMNYSNSKD